MRQCYEGVLDNQVLPIGFKAVMPDMRSLGLRQNPTSYHYSQGTWLIMPDHHLVPGIEDYGGIWTYKRFSNARAGQNYMLRKYDQQTRVFLTFGIDVLFENDDRFKTNGILFAEEITCSWEHLKNKYRIRTVLNPDYHRRAS